jgi:Ca2+-binding RTX toxin-like protein
VLHRGARRSLDLLITLALSVGVVSLLAPDAAWAQTCNGRAAGAGPGGPGNDVIEGSFLFPDTIDGEGGNDIICGRGGNDTLIGNAGNDLLFGSWGRDEMSLGPASAPGEPEAAYGGSGSDDITGGDGNDQLIGGGGFDELEGGPGEDTIDGGRRGDRIVGGPDNDILRGGSGNDFIDAFTGGGDDTVDGGDGLDRCHISLGDTVTNCELFTK